MQDTTAAPNTGVSNASDFQPLTQNPQNNVSNVQSTQSLQAPSQGLTQEALNIRQQNLRVETDQNTGTLVPGSPRVDVAEARVANEWIIVAIVIIVLSGFFLLRRKRAPRKIAARQTAGQYLPAVAKAKPSRRPKSQKTRPRKKAKTKR